MLHCGVKRNIASLSSSVIFSVYDQINDNFFMSYDNYGGFELYILLQDFAKVKNPLATAKCYLTVPSVIKIEE